MEAEEFMKKTTILLPEDLRNRASRRAYSRGISFGQLAREAIEKYLTEENRKRDDTDPFFDDCEVFEASAPEDGSTDFEDSLYGSKP